MTTLLLFLASFAAVCTLGLQQINVERRSLWAAALTSPLIGISHLVLFKELPGPTDALQIGGYLVGGATGIVASIWAHPRLVALFASKGGLSEGGRFLTPRERMTRHPWWDCDAPAAEPLSETLCLATELADDIARTDIENHCTYDRMGRFVWYDTTTPSEEAFEVEGGITKAVRYLTLRKRIVFHPQVPHLVRFEQ